MSTPGVTAATTFVFVPGMVEGPAIKICPVIPFEIRTVVCIVETVAEVAVPGRIVIVGISGIISFTYYRCGGGSVSIFILVDRSWFLVNGSRLLIYYGRCSYIYPGAGKAETKMCVDINLGISAAGKETGGYNRGKDK